MFIHCVRSVYLNCAKAGAGCSSTDARDSVCATHARSKSLTNAPTIASHVWSAIPRSSSAQSSSNRAHAERSSSKRRSDCNAGTNCAVQRATTGENQFSWFDCCRSMRFCSSIFNSLCAATIAFRMRLSSFCRGNVLSTNSGVSWGTSCAFARAWSSAICAWSVATCSLSSAIRLVISSASAFCV